MLIREVYRRPCSARRATRFYSVNGVLFECIFSTCRPDLFLAYSPPVCMGKKNAFHVPSSQNDLRPPNKLNCAVSTAHYDRQKTCSPCPRSASRSFFPVCTACIDLVLEQEEIEMLRQQLAKASLEASDSSGGAGLSRALTIAKENAPEFLSGRLAHRAVM